jgi:hypothetical protein
MDDRIRASDADRDRVTARLREHYALGRLDQGELEERINDALSAKTFGDLRQVMIDLPEPAPAPARAAPDYWPMAGPAPHRVSQYRRRGPRLFPLLMIGFVVAFLASGGGPAAVPVKLAALTALATVGIFLFLAYLGGRLFHRSRPDWDRGQHHHPGHWHHDQHDGWSRW